MFVSPHLNQAIRVFSLVLSKLGLVPGDGIWKPGESRNDREPNVALPSEMNKMFARQFGFSEYVPR